MSLIAFYLPEWVPASHYLSIATSLGLEDIRMADWTEYITPFWSAVIESALQPSTFVKMLLSGTSTLQSAYTAVSC
jgi:tocopherol O-methyltransferase